MSSLLIYYFLLCLGFQRGGMRVVMRIAFVFSIAPIIFLIISMSCRMAWPAGSYNILIRTTPSLDLEGLFWSRCRWTRDLVARGEGVLARV